MNALKEQLGVIFNLRHDCAEASVIRQRVEEGATIRGNNAVIFFRTTRKDYTTV